jgi:heme/copper-type cytochrome/quinol oxidase subunit 3
MELRPAANPANDTELYVSMVRTGSRIFAAGLAFFFVAFLFAFFYLRALDSNGIWRGWPGHHPHPSQAFGIAILVCVLVSAAVLRISLPLAIERWRLGVAASLALGLGAVVLQIIQFTSLGFGPTDGGYASVFVGWTGLFALIALGTMLWLWTSLAESLRAGATEIVRAATEAISFCWAVLALVAAVAYVLLYLVA